MVTLGDYLFVSGLLFTIGFAGVLLRRNIIIIFMSLELMLNAANLSLVAFSRFRVDSSGLPELSRAGFRFLHHHGGGGRGRGRPRGDRRALSGAADDPRRGHQHVEVLNMMTKRDSELRVAHASRVLATASSPSRTFFAALLQESRRWLLMSECRKSPSRWNTATSTRDACAPRLLAAHGDR